MSCADVNDNFFHYKVKVFRVDDVQGEEFQALIISTVRTCIKEPPAEEDGGFLTDPRVSHRVAVKKTFAVSAAIYTGQERIANTD